MDGTDTREERWHKEAEFFDGWAREIMADLRPAHPFVLERYGKLRRRRFSKEFRFRIMGELQDKSVLDVGCGDGLNAITLAKLGARVTGIDISPQAIQVARERARINGVEQQTTFVCSPVESASVPSGSFDIVWADAFLHHVLPELEKVMGQLCRCAKPDGLLVLSEPISFSGFLRRLRLMLPIASNATPDERPLRRDEIEVVRRHLTPGGMRCFSFFDRLNRFVLPHHTYESAFMAQKAAVDALSGMDWVILSLPFAHLIAGSCVVYGQPRR